jgi:hypothetical protein
VLAHDRRSTLWDAARLLTVGEEGYAYRARVGAHVRTLPEFKEIAEFFTAELTAQLADSRSTTTAKLDAPVNKLARLLNSPSIKRVLLNDSLTVDLDRVIAGGEVLVVKGALGAMGAGNTSVLMQLLVGMLDAALARQQDTVPADRSRETLASGRSGETLASGEHPRFSQRVAVALKVDEAPLVLNRGFAETLALKRSAGLETVACWQTDAQWTDRDVRAQLDALFAHRVYFATASVADARDAASLMMAEYSDTVRPEITGLSALGHPDARLHLPKHYAIASWVAPEGRQAPFLASTIPLRIDDERLALHAARQAARGGRYLDDLSQPHWDRSRETLASSHPRFGQREPGPRGEERGESLGIVRAGGREGEAGGRGVSIPRDDGGAKAGGEDHGNETGERAGGARAPLPDAAAESYAELVDLDAAHRVRWASAVAAPRSLDPDPLDLEILALVVSMRHVLTSQIHRRFNHGRAMTTTQRRLKRLSDAALVERFQFHRRDGGGAPMCYVIAPLGIELLRVRGRLDALAQGEVDEVRDPSPKSKSSSSVSHSASPSSSLPVAGDGRLRQARHDVHSSEPAPLSASPSSSLPVAGDGRLRQARYDVHVTGWVLALERALGGTALRVRGPEESVISPPQRFTPAGRVAIGPGDLRLPGGRTPHDFLRTDAAGARVEVERFETVRPDASVEVGAGVCLLVELDDRLATRAHLPAVAKLERYDHLLAGWSVYAPRFAGRPSPSGCVPPIGPGAARVGPSPAVVFLCRDRLRARECARRADHALRACRAYAGEYPSDWEYPGRAAIVFASERDAHEELLLAYGVPRLPPEVRAAAAGGDPRAREAAFEPRELPVRR